MRVLLDTNVLIAAFISRGGGAELLEHCATKHQLVSSQFILDEFREKLHNKFKFSPKTAVAAVRLLSRRSILINPEPLAEAVCRDRDDDHILAAAFEGNCDCIVTGDEDLLVIERYRRIPIVAPRDFWRLETAL